MLAGGASGPKRSIALVIVPCAAVSKKPFVADQQEDGLLPLESSEGGGGGSDRSKPP